MSKQPPPAPAASAVGPCPTESKLQDAPALDVYPGFVKTNTFDKRDDFDFDIVTSISRC